MSLDARLRARLGSLDLALDLTVGDEVVAVLGPNGAGKTTLLRALAGLLPIDEGRITLDGTVLDDPAADVFVPPASRCIGVVFQDYLLFPFLSARDNVAFGLRSRGTTKVDARRRADAWLARLGLSDRTDARPSELSGGQAQRVALARAVVFEPRLLLLDEPLAALDAGARIEIRRELRAQLAEVPGARVIVTHDPVDAAALADRVVILEQGVVTQQGSLDEVTLHPRSAYVADLVGLNLYRGIARDGVVHLHGGGEIVVADRAITGEVHVAFPPRAVAVHLQAPGGSVRNHWAGVVSSVDRLGDRVRIGIDGPIRTVAEVTPIAAGELALAPGRAVVAAVKAAETQVYGA